uniref:Uncharacterized protein n=1 Tax=Anguilla anguilla TaxID=7936 RepID=A0A0E9X1E0_ANGAN
MDSCITADVKKGKNKIFVNLIVILLNHSTVQPDIYMKKTTKQINVKHRCLSPKCVMAVFILLLMMNDTILT